MGCKLVTSLYKVSRVGEMQEGNFGINGVEGGVALQSSRRTNLQHIIVVHVKYR